MRPRAAILAIALAACAPTVAPSPVTELAATLTPEMSPDPPEADPVPEPVPVPVPDPEPAEDPEPEKLPLAEVFPEKRVPAIEKLRPHVESAAAEHELDPDLVCGLIWVESKFETRARGPAGALGLMQIMPRTGKGLAKRLKLAYRPYDPEFSLAVGTYLLARMLDKFEGDETLALAAYNRGGGTVRKWIEAGEPLPEGTQAFTERVLDARARFATVAW